MVYLSMKVDAPQIAMRWQF